MRLTIILVVVSFFLLGNSSCSSTARRIDAFQCILINVDQNGSTMPVENWFWRCVNQRSGVKKNIAIQDSDKCIRDPNKACKFYGTDVDEIERVKKWYQDNAQCPMP